MMKKQINSILDTDAYDFAAEDALNRKIDPSNKDSETYLDLAKAEMQGEDGSGKFNMNRVRETDAFHAMAKADSMDARILHDLLTEGKSTLLSKAPKIGEFFGDFLSVKDFPAIVGPTMEVVLKNYMLPQMLISKEVFRTVPYTGTAEEVRINSIGPIEVEEIGHGEPYPSTGTAIEDQAYRIRLEIKKYGRKLEIEQDLIDSDNWGILQFYTSQIADGFVMRKEDTCMNLVNRMGTTIYNNASPSNSELEKITTGRGIDGSPNGTLSLNDMIEMWLYGEQRGFNYSLLMMHPFAWAMFANDPEIREIIKQGSTASQNSAPRPNGSAAGGFEDPLGAYGYIRKGFGAGPESISDPSLALGKLGIVPFTNQLTPWGSDFYLDAAGFPTAMRILVTPRVPFIKDPTSKKFITNFYMIDPAKTGILLQGEGPTTIEWDDKEREIHSIAWKERWGVAPLFQGRGVGVARNIVIDKNYVFDNVNQVSLSALPNDLTSLTGTHTGISWGS